MAHEHYHAEEMYKISFNKYVKDAPLAGTNKADYTSKNWQHIYKREKYVYDQINKNAKTFDLNGQELWHSWAYIEEVKYTLTELNIKIPK